MKKFDFFFGLNLGQSIFFHVDSLSGTLEKASMSAASGKQNAKLTSRLEMMDVLHHAS